jgi:hypothetical protein
LITVSSLGVITGMSILLDALSVWPRLCGFVGVQL